MSTISVIGTGYLGATHAAAMAEMGHTVIGIDTDPNKVATLNQGKVPFFEPGLPELLSTHVASGRLTFTSDFADAAPADIHFLCVGTPQQAGSDAADLSQVFGSFTSLLPHLDSNSLIVGKSTVPVGTCAQLADVAAAEAGAVVAWNPEFLREGFAVEDTLRPDRIVVGVRQPQDADRLRELYQPQIQHGAPFLVTDYATAELVKVSANAFLATKISYINAIADICSATGADVVALAEAIGHDDRIGSKFLRAGVGFGGGCLPKDIRAFMARADELGVGRSLDFLREIDEINMRRRQSVAQSAADMLAGSLLGAHIAVLGVAFKPDSDDIRDSPALNIAANLHLQGAAVQVFDPKAMGNAAKAFPTLNYANDLNAALDNADLVMLLTEWPEFAGLDPVRTGTVVKHRRILDGRNVLDASAWRGAGWEYRGIGIP